MGARTPEAPCATPGAVASCSMASRRRVAKVHGAEGPIGTSDDVGIVLALHVRQPLAQSSPVAWRLSAAHDVSLLRT
jgi:hypothetical protein